MFLKTTSQESFYAPECFLGSVACKFWIRCIIWDLLQILTSLFLLGHFHHHPDPNLCDDKNNPFTLLYSGPAGQYKKVGGHPGHFLQFCGRHLQTFSHKSVHWHIFIKECTYVVLGEPPPKKKRKRKKKISPKCGWVGWLIPKQGPNPSKPPKSPRKSPLSTRISFFVLPNLTESLGWVNRFGRDLPPKEVFFYALPYRDHSQQVKICKIANSRTWCPGNPDCDDPKMLCQDLVDDYHAFQVNIYKIC